MNQLRTFGWLAVLALAWAGTARAATEKEVISQVKASIKAESSTMKTGIKNVVDAFSTRLNDLLQDVEDGVVVGSNVLPPLEDAINDAVLANYQATLTAWNNVRASAKTIMLLAALDLPRDLEQGNFTTADKFQDAIAKAGEAARKKMTSLLKKFHAGFHKASSVSYRINAVIVEQPVARRPALNRIHTADATLDFRLTGIVAGRNPDSVFFDGLIFLGGVPERGLQRRLHHHQRQHDDLGGHVHADGQPLGPWLQRHRAGQPPHRGPHEHRSDARLHRRHRRALIADGQKRYCHSAAAAASATTAQPSAKAISTKIG